MEKVVSSVIDINAFCQSCDESDEQKCCHGQVNSSEKQLYCAEQGKCDWAKVEGTRGVMIRDGFIPQDWMARVVSSFYSCITESIREKVNQVSPEKIQQAKGFVESELEAIRKQHPNQPESMYYETLMDNFHLYLPLLTSPGSSYKEMMIKSNTWGKTYKQDSEDFGGEVDEGVSQLRLEQTNAEFIGTIYAAIEVEGISLEKIIRLQGKPGERRRDGSLLQLRKLVLPTFIRLLALGYHRYPDLT